MNNVRRVAQHVEGKFVHQITVILNLGINGLLLTQEMRDFSDFMVEAANHCTVSPAKGSRGFKD